MDFHNLFSTNKDTALLYGSLVDEHELPDSHFNDSLLQPWTTAQFNFTANSIQQPLQPTINNDESSLTKELCPSTFSEEFICVSFTFNLI